MHVRFEGGLGGASLVLLAFASGAGAPSATARSATARSATDVVPTYATADLNLGVRQRGACEASLYGKNITNNNNTITTPTVAQITGITQFFGNTGYTTIQRLRQREFGIVARYAFGAR